MLAKYLPPLAAPRLSGFTRSLLLVAASCLAGPAALAQAAGGASPAAAAANADMVSWMARGLLAAVVVVTVLTGLVLLVVFSTDRRPAARPLAPAPAPAVPRPRAVAA